MVIGSSEYILPEDLPELLLEGRPADGTVIFGLHDDVNDFKKVRVRTALLKTDGNREQAADLLGISLSQLNRLIRNFGL